MLSFALTLYLSFVALTSRIRVTSTNEEAIASLRERRPTIYAYWFEHVLFVLYYFGGRKMPVLMTPQAKTDTATRVAERMGLRVAKGSLEGGGRHALVTLMDCVKAGESVVLFADGPRGPKRKCKAGAFILAQECAVPIVPVSWRAFMRIKLPRRGGSIYLPLPFNSIEIRMGSPLMVDKHYQFAELEGVKAMLTSQLDRLAQ